MKRILTAAIALSLLGGAAASAQPRDDDRHDRREIQRDVRHDVQRDVRRDVGRDVRRADEHYIYRGQTYPRWRGQAFVYPRGYAYRPWVSGQRLPAAYFAPNYYVTNWGYYHLAPPPPGYRYVRVGNDIVLAAIAGGLISQVIAGAFY